MLSTLILLGLGWSAVGLDEPAAAPVAGYPRGDLLVEPTDLASLAPKIVLLDARSMEQFAKGHFAGAVPVDPDDWDAAFAAKAEPTAEERAAWSQRIGALGIDGRKPVVVYGQTLPSVARVWYLLAYWGVPDTRMVNGTWPAIADKQQSRPIVTKQFDQPKPASFNVAPRRDLLATKTDVLRLALLPEKSEQILDARSQGEFQGSGKPTDRTGHLPTACHLDWSNLVDRKTGRFLPADQLRARLANAGIRLSQPVVAHCQGGGRSAVMTFALRLLGNEKAANYYRSFGEWQSDPSLPVVKPALPQKTADTPATNK